MAERVGDDQEQPCAAELILAHARKARLVVTLEESVVTGGFGSGVLEAIEGARIADAGLRGVQVQIIGIPGDRFVDHGAVTDLRRLIRLDVPGLVGQIAETAAALGMTASAAAAR